MKRTLLILLLIPCAIPGQVVEAHFAQNLITATMARHPELQKMGLHVVPPNASDDVIIACSVPTKIGKKSSPGDLEVERTGGSTVKTNQAGSFYDLALPLKDSTGHPLGLTVMEMRFSGASSADDALAKASAIEHHLESEIESLATLLGLRLLPLRSSSYARFDSPEVQGDFDHFAVNAADNRLYVSAEVRHSIEVFNLQTGEHLESVAGVTTPHTLAFDAESKRLLVADGGDSSCRILSGSDLHQVARIPLEAGPDAGIYDSVKHIFYIGNGGRKANLPYSYITLVAASEAKAIGHIRVESNNLEAMAIDRDRKLLYVNLRDKNQIGVIDLDKNEVRQTWSVPGLNLNTPMQFDARNHRLFVAGRKPGKLFIINSDNGQLISSLDCVDTADDMAFDHATRRIYVSGSGGLTIVQQEGSDSYKLIEQFPTNSGKTSTLVQDLKQLYVIHTKTAEDMAALQVYKLGS